MPSKNYMKYIKGGGCKLFLFQWRMSRSAGVFCNYYIQHAGMQLCKSFIK